MLTRRPFQSCFVVCAALIGLASLATPAVGDVIVLTFEGLGDLEDVENFYNGGTGSDGGSGEDYGVSFTSNARGLIDSDVGGSGGQGDEPTPDTVLFFLGGDTTTMNVADGFDTGFSFFYSAAFMDGGSVHVYDGLDGTGNLLASIDVPRTERNGAPDPTGNWSPFFAQGSSFEGTAMSVDFSEANGRVAFDNVTIGSEIAAGQVPEPGTVMLLGLGCLGMGAAALRRRRKGKADA